MSSKPGKLSKHFWGPLTVTKSTPACILHHPICSGTCVKSTYPNGHGPTSFANFCTRSCVGVSPRGLGPGWAWKNQLGMVSWQTFGASVRYNIVQRCTDYWNISKGSRMVSLKEDEERFNSWHWWHSNSFWDMLVEFFEYVWSSRWKCTITRVCVSRSTKRRICGQPVRMAITSYNAVRQLLSRRQLLHSESTVMFVASLF